MGIFDPPANIEEQRQRVWCRNRHKDGRVCSLYKDHFGDHKEKHLKSSWANENG